MKKGVGILIGILFGLNIVLVVFIFLILTGVVDVRFGNSSKLDPNIINEVDNNTDDNKVEDNTSALDDAKYSAIIDEYKKAMNDENYDENMDNYLNINSTMVHYYHLYKNGNYSGIMTVNYVYYDINKDGSNELIILASYDSMKDEILDIFTYDGSKGYRFLIGGVLGERCHASIYDNGLVYFYGSGGAAVHGLTFYKISGDGYSRETVKDFGVTIHDGVYSIESNGNKLNYKSDEEAIASVVNGASKVDLTSLDWKEIK